MDIQLAKTPLHAWHADHGGRMVDFAGWSMPVHYGSIVEEHVATRSGIGLFDVSHMGRLRFDGPDAAQFLDRVVTRRVADLPPGKIRYSVVCRQDGGILDDVLVYRLEGGAESYFQLVVNASNRRKIIDWLNSQRGDARAEMTDLTTETAMIAVQGPQANQVVSELAEISPATLKYYNGRHTKVCGKPTLLSRTGYTGEDGCELILAAEDALEVWQTLLEAGQSAGARPAGLGARDTLRLESAMPLYGHELSEQINPIEAGLQFAVNLANREFIGRDAIAKIVKQGAEKTRVGLELSSRRVPRQHCPILAGDEQVGEVTSGTFSPTLQKSIAMGLVPPANAAVGTELAVDIRGRPETAVVVSLPFYQRKT